MNLLRFALAFAILGLVALAAHPDPSPQAGRVTPAAPMLEARSGHTATLLPDGRVLITGGYANDDRATAQTWIYRP